MTGISYSSSNSLDAFQINPESFQVEVVHLEGFKIKSLRLAHFGGKIIEMKHICHKKCLSRDSLMKQESFILKTTLATVEVCLQN